MAACCNTLRCGQYTGLAFFKPKMKALPLPPWMHTATVHAQLAGELQPKTVYPAGHTHARPSERNRDGIPGDTYRADGVSGAIRVPPSRSTSVARPCKYGTTRKPVACAQVC
jgi:hypothetical protein